MKSCAQRSLFINNLKITPVSSNGFEVKEHLLCQLFLVKFEVIEDKGQLEMITLTKPSELCHHRIRGPEASKVAAMMSTVCIPFFSLGFRKILRMFEYMLQSRESSWGFLSTL